MIRRHQSGWTFAEVATVIVTLVVIAAVAIPMWRTHDLRSRRDDAVESLMALQAAQDQYFGKFAHYANQSQLGVDPPEGLGVKATSRRGFYDIALTNSADDLEYWATARVKPLERKTPDSRCVELRIDQNGRRFAIDADGADRSADCWSVN